MRILYDPKAEVVFRKIFGMHMNLFISFLNALLPLGEEDKIVSIEYQEPDVLPNTPGNLNDMMVVRCTDARKRAFLVQIQMLWTESFMNHSLFNASKAIDAQSKPGLLYDAFLPVYSLCLLNDNILSLEEFEDEYIHNFYIQDEHHSKVRMKGMVFVLVELMKFQSANSFPKRLADLWLRFLTFIEKDEKGTIPEELKTDPDVNAAVECLENMHLTDVERHEYEKYWDAVSYERSLAAGKFAEGDRQRAYKVAKVMLAKGIDTASIVKATDLTLEEIYSIQIGEAHFPFP